MKQGCKPSRGQRGSHPGSYLVDTLSQASIFNQPDAEGGDGTLPPHIDASAHQLCLNRARSGHFDVPDEALF